MRILRGNRHSGRSGYADDSSAGAAAVADREADDRLGRFEAQAIATPAFATDPYAAWVQRRESERRLQERAEVRWVYRYPGRYSGQGTGGSRDASGQRAPEGGLVGVG
jgi:hypothetical protein